MVKKRGPGRVPHAERWTLAAKLRAEGLTLQEIGVRLGGISHQAVNQLLSRRWLAPAVEVSCVLCVAFVASVRMQKRIIGEVLCSRCLASRPDTPFGQRLRSRRVAAGWNRSKLARVSGVAPYHLMAYEDGIAKPHRATRVKLAAALGAKDLERFGDEE